MPQEPQTALLAQARDNLVEGCYGQFDLVPALFPLPLLLQEKPRQLRRMIAARLEVPLEQVRYRTFISWLARFRARHASISQQQGQDVDAASFRETKPLDWKGFQASTPERKDPDPGTLLSFPAYD
jgi:hypothetical protein